MHGTKPSEDLQLAEILGALSLATDLVNGQQPETALRCTILAVQLARARNEPQVVLEDIYWTGLLRFIGCSGFAVEEAPLAAGDDIGLRQVFMRIDMGKPSKLVGAVVFELGRAAPIPQRARSVARFLSSPALPMQHAWAQCDAAQYFARKMGMSKAVVDALAQVDERFDGNGLPLGLKGEQIALPLRYVELARVAVVSQLGNGTLAALDEVGKRSGGAIDPLLSKDFLAHAVQWCQAVAVDSVWEAFLACEPGRRTVRDAELDALYEAFAQFSDLKSAYTLGHSTGVARLAEAAAEMQGLKLADRKLLRHAALLHDLGRVSVNTSIWDKPGALNVAEWERVRLHAYYTDRVLRRSPELSQLAAVAGRAHERLDGSGYFRGDAAAALDRLARLLACADQYHACTEHRAHRPAMSASAAAAELRESGERGKLCKQAVQAVLAAAGERTRQPAAQFGALSEREVEVINLIAIGLSNKEVGKRLGISPRTVQHHTIHIYDKIGVASRAGAALYASEHGLLRPTPGGSWN